MPSQVKLSLIQVVNEFRTFATNHLMINDFDFADAGSFGELASTREFTYPVFFTTIGGAGKDKNAFIYNMKIYIADLTDGTSAGNLEVISDMAQVVADFLAWLEAHEDLHVTVKGFAQPALTLSTDADKGFLLDIDVAVAYYGNTCVIPMAA